MQEQFQLDPVRGMRDHLPRDQQQLLSTRAALEAALDSWGYEPIDLPVLERRDLYLKKAGEDLVAKLYDFVFQGRNLALRPEWTASVLRAYLKSMQSEPLPLRLRYGGPVFRYERPQRVTYRQFTQVGVELVGGAAPRGDAEVIALACEALAAAGVEDWKLIIGHVGVARTLLAQLGLPERTASQLLWNMERLRRGGAAELRAQLQPAIAVLPEELQVAHNGQSEEGQYPDAVRHPLGPLAELPDDDLAELLATTVQAMGLSLESTSRPAGAIIERLIRKLRQDDPQSRIDQALSSLERLSGAYGEPGPAIAHAAGLLHDLQLPAGPLDELTTIVELVVGAGVDPARLVVDLGLSRGLHYYSGMIFEIEGADGLQLCGGGRYDDLIGVLQRRPRSAAAPDIPAAGFAFGLERVAAQSRRRAAESAPTLLIMAPDARFKLAMRVAGALRLRGYRVLLDARARTLQANLRDAGRRGCSALVALDGAKVDVVETLDETSLHWYDLGSHGETNAVRRIPLSALEAGASIST